MGRPTLLEQVRADDRLAEESADQVLRLRAHKFRLWDEEGREFTTWWYWDPEADGTGRVPAYDAAKEAFLDAWTQQCIGSVARNRKPARDAKEEAAA